SVGKVTVELKLIKINLQSKLKVTIKDNGIGISATALPYIFDRFYRVDPARSNQAKNPTGTGLGLAIAKAIVENHQGQIKVSSQVCQGTTFEVYLPALIAVKT
ncbi:MAG: sensor histidine kinase, partial [Cyanobacteria bacterium J083]